MAAPHGQRVENERESQFTLSRHLGPLSDLLEKIVDDLGGVGLTWLALHAALNWVSHLTLQ
jgi:hypothetical protein